MGEILKTEALVIGSGAGGALTASLLAERGFNVAIIEEGPRLMSEDVSPSVTEMMRKMYRRGGITPIIGRPNIALAEGRCVGGGTEINSAIYHRPPDDVIKRWQRDFDIKDFSIDNFLPFYERIEKDISVTPASPNTASEILKSGADKLGWKGVYAPRAQKDCVDANMCATGCPTGAKQSMSVTYIPRALNAGVKLISDCKAVKIETTNNHANGVFIMNIKNSFRKVSFIKADYIFVCGGSIQTPCLLQRSNIKKNIGKSLCLHPTIKVAAKFKEELNLHEKAFPTYQVKEFSPAISFGGAVFSPSYAALVLKNINGNFHELMRYWRHIALYYTMTVSSGKGRIMQLPFTKNSVIAGYFLTKADRKNLSEGVAKLSELLLTAGAEEVYLDIHGHPPTRTIKECRYYSENLIPFERANLYTIHIFSSCPMGEDKDKCAVDSFGRIHGFENIYVNDASILPDAPGVNPQGSIMAIAMRNVEHFVSNCK